MSSTSMVHLCASGVGPMMSFLAPVEAWCSTLPVRESNDIKNTSIYWQLFKRTISILCKLNINYYCVSSENGLVIHL